MTRLLFNLTLMVTFFSSWGCEEKGTPGSSCRRDKDCKGPLYCSSAGRCQKPVSCKKIQSRLKACTGAFLEQVVVGYGRLPLKRRKKLSSSLQRRLPKEVYLTCLKRNTATKKKTGPHPSARAKENEKWKSCLQKGACDAFARCALRLAKYNPSSRSVRNADLSL